MTCLWGEMAMFVKPGLTLAALQGAKGGVPTTGDRCLRAVPSAGIAETKKERD